MTGDLVKKLYSNSSNSSKLYYLVKSFSIDLLVMLYHARKMPQQTKRVLHFALELLRDPSLRIA